MNKLWEIPVSSVTALTAERSVVVTRAILRAECGYAKQSPAALTISSRLTTADGGIDAEVNVPPELAVPADCIFRPGLTGYQIKSGMTFRPWTASAIRGELLDSKGRLHSEVERLVRRHGCYSLLCTGHDLTPKQRNDSRSLITKVLEEAGFGGYQDQIEILGASQIVEFAERYPGTASLLSSDPIQEAWLIDEWKRDAHMANAFEESEEQTQMISRIRAGIQKETKHIRVLGEPGLGKTRIVLESVKEPLIAPYVLYIQHGSQFGQTRLFRQLLKSGYDKPLVLVIDELPESELSDIWRYLKPRCGSLKIVSLDHGRDETSDEEIERLRTPRLPDETIQKILVNQVGESREIDRWVAICEGSPRVAQAVADNLCANPDDILKPPTTVPIWTRFLHGYGKRDETGARQVDCVAQHLALFSRFGYEAPVGDEAQYIAELIREVDPTIGWARFQEIVQALRGRRVLQGSRTLFFVPKALHIYLWKKFWESYGRGFDFTKTFNAMPESLHVWFMSMFKYAGGATTSHVIDEILRLDGIFSQHDALISEKGSRFLSILAEANPVAVLSLLEATLGYWTDQDLLGITDSRQQLVWALEKIAVWPAYTVRAIRLLSRLALNENSDYSNNSTGTLVGLFRIGPEAAATESTPEARLPALLRLLCGTEDAERQLGLKAMRVALDSCGRGIRIVGPEYQGLRKRAKLWIPATYGDLWQAKFAYFQALVDETRNWPASLRPEVCEALLEAVKQQIKTPPCTELALHLLGELADDSAMSPEKLNDFFYHWREYEDASEHPDIARRLRTVEGRYTRRDLTSRFQRYVLGVNWKEWDEDFRERRNKPKNRAKVLVNALARRIARHPEKIIQIQHLLAPGKNAPALWHFSEQLALNDESRTLLPELIRVTQDSKHDVCLRAYLSAVRANDPEHYVFLVREFLGKNSTAWLGASITLRSDYEDKLFILCLDALEKGWVDPLSFEVLRFGMMMDKIPPARVGRLFHLLNTDDVLGALFLLLELLDKLPFDDTSPFSSAFVFGVASRTVPDDKGLDVMHGYHWRSVCSKLANWDASLTLPLLEMLLTEMGKKYSLSYDHDVERLANELVQVDPSGAWNIVKAQFEQILPKWRSDLFSWLKGGISTFDEGVARGPIADLPVPEIREWIDKDVASRAPLIAHASLGTLDDEQGGRLTRELLLRYGQVDGVQSGISATFHSGGWTGSTSAYLKRKREKFRKWLAAGFESEVTQWIEGEIEYLDRKIVAEEIKEERSRFE